MRIAAFALAAWVAAAAAHAQEGRPPEQAPAGQGGTQEDKVRQGQVDDEWVPAADPRQSYIFFRTSRKMGLLFMRETNAAEAEAERAAVLVDARRDYQEMLSEWRETEAGCQGERAATSRCRDRRPEPAEPTLESAAAMLEPDRNIEPVLRNPVFGEEGGAFTYLVAVRPGTYVLYGQRDGRGSGWAGVCLCMGSVRFEVAAGQVADLGTVTYPALDAAAARPSADSAFTDTGPASIAIVPPRPDARLPARLSALTMVPARLHAAGKMSNLFGLHIDRHPALAGVLRYERDLVIDDSTGQAAAAGP